MTLEPLGEHYFRHEYGNLVATMTRRFGVGRLADIEDAVHSSLLAAVEAWPISGRPENPQGWLFRVACNHLLGELRQRSHRSRILERAVHDDRLATGSALDLGTAEHISADLLRMLFACCHESIPPASQLVFALKAMAGFSIGEIARRLCVTEANAHTQRGTYQNPCEPKAKSEHILRNNLRTKRKRSHAIGKVIRDPHEIRGEHCEWYRPKDYLLSTHT